MNLKRLTTRLANDYGSILVAAMIMSTLVVLLGIVYLTFANIQMQAVDLDILRIQAKYAAIYGSTTGVLDCKTYSYPGEHTGPVVGLNDEVSYQFWNGLPGGGGGGLFSWASYRVYSLGMATSKDGHTSWMDTITAAYSSQTMADFLWITNTEIDDSTHDTVYFWTPDTLDGPVHSNNYIHIHPIQNHPVFKEKVTSVKPDTKPPWRTSGAWFKKGFYGSYGAIIFPDQADSIRFWAGPDYTFGDNNLLPDSMWFIRLVGDSFYVTAKPTTVVPNFNDTLDWGTVRKMPLPASGAIFVKGTLYIDAPKVGIWRGLEGRVTIGAAGNIYIYHDILYASSLSNGYVPYNSMDVLGLISERYILVSTYNNYPTTRQFRINSALAALNGSISYQGIYSYPPSAEYQSLFIYGCLAQRSRGTVHSSYPARGFIEKDYKYDSRFHFSPPPHWIPAGNYTEQYSESYGCE